MNIFCISNKDNTTVQQAIIHVNVHQQGRDNGITTYASYDSGSTGCFFIGRVDEPNENNRTEHSSRIVYYEWRN